MRRSSCVSTWASREAGTSQNERRHGMLHRGVLHSAMPGMIPCVSSSHAPWWHVSRWEGHASWFRGHAVRWLPHGNHVKLAAPTTKHATTQQTCIVGKIQDSRRHPVTIGSMPVGCPHGKSRRPLPAIGSASSMSIECLLLLERDDGQISLRPPVSVGDVAAAGSAEVTLCNAKADPKL